MAFKEMIQGSRRAASWLWARHQQLHPQARAALYGAVVGVLVIVYYDGRVLRSDREAQIEWIASAQAEVEALGSVIEEIENYKAHKIELENFVDHASFKRTSERREATVLLVLRQLSGATAHNAGLDRLSIEGDEMSLRATGDRAAVLALLQEIAQATGVRGTLSDEPGAAAFEGVFEIQAPIPGSEDAQ